MSAAKTESKPEATKEYRITGGLWASAWKIAAAVGVIGIGASFAIGMGDQHRFAFSYLFAFLFFLTIALGATFFVLVERLTGAMWSVTVRRTAEFFMSGLPVMAILFVPILMMMGQIFPWMHPAVEHTAAPTAEHAESSHEAAAPQHEASVSERHMSSADLRAEQIEGEEHAKLLVKKKAFLNITFFLIRVAIYFLAWTLIAMKFFGWSVKQDQSKDPKLTLAAQKFAPISAIVMGLTLTFAGFDWVMALYPYWYSTIFGVWFFAGGFVGSYAVITLVTLSLRSAGFTGDTITHEHYHDLGKLTFGFLVFWAYISFAQFFLIWYAAIPEETIFYHHRWGDGPFKTVSLMLLFVHFVLPFFVLLSRNAKRNLAPLAIGCAIIVVMHMVEMYWAVMPNYIPTPGGEPGDVLQLSLLDLTSVLGVGGIYLAWVFRQMTSHSLIAVGDPRLPRSLAFENA